jgi:hypothetical protein
MKRNNINKPRTTIFVFRNFLAIVIFVSILFSFSCNKQKHIVKNNIVDSTKLQTCKIDRRPPRPLINEMWKNEFKFEWLSAKIDCEATQDSSKFIFDVSVRIRKDSVIWLIVTDPVIGIPIARLFITRDSVKFIQKLPEEKCFRGNFSFLSQLLQTEIDFEMIQSLLIGNSVSFYQEEEKLNASINHSECSYTLSTVRKRKLKKVLSTPNTPPTDPLQTISLDPISFKILNILFIDDQNKTISAKYGDFTLEDSMPYPHKVEFYARGAKSSAQLGIKIHRIKLNQPLEFPFNIPQNCPSIITNTDSQIQKPKPPQNGKR